MKLKFSVLFVFHPRRCPVVHMCFWNGLSCHLKHITLINTNVLELKGFFLFWNHRNAGCIIEQIKTTQIVKFLFDDLSGLFDSRRNEGRKTNRLKSKLEKIYQSNCPNQIKWIVFHSLSNRWTNFIIDLSTIAFLSLCHFLCFAETNWSEIEFSRVFEWNLKID